MSTTTETHAFQAEVQELLDLMIHSLYSNREVFLRELISNASDALDKRRIEALQHPERAPEDARARILLSGHPEGRLLEVGDTGVGMSRDELVENLGTIARSGTRRFLEDLKEGDGAGLIGRFGVGFYASFMVADEVTVETRRAGNDEGWRWRSRGDGQYTLEPCPGLDVGTRVRLHLREADEERGDPDWLDPRVLAGLVRRYSDFVEHPIEMDAAAFPEDAPFARETLPSGESVVLLNTRKPLWARPKDEVSDEEHAEFYRHLTHAHDDPATRVHFRAEGAQAYAALLYVPTERPFEPLPTGEPRSRVALYVRRVLIEQECEELLPPWLRFVRGVVDSDDLPLNVSREVLQGNRAVGRIRERLVRKVLDALATLLEGDRETYERVWAAFGAVLKEGVVMEPELGEDVAKVCLFAHSAGDGLCTLDEALESLAGGADDAPLHYVLAENLERARGAPQIEALRARGTRVLFLVDPIDEWLVQRLTAYRGHPLVAADRGADKDESAERRELRETRERECRDLLERLEAHLGERVSAVRLSSRLTDSVAALVADEHALGRHMRRLMEAQGGAAPPERRALELNLDHPLVGKLEALAARDADAGRLADYAELLYGQALLAEGSPLPDPARFGRLVSELMASGLDA